jgi:hypothetical protein
MTNHFLLLCCFRLAGVVAALTFSARPAMAQFVSGIYVDTAMVPVGSEAAEIRVYNSISSQQAQFSIKWNGADRPVRTDGMGTFYLKLLPEDTAKSGLGELTVTNRKTGAAAGSWLIPVGFNVLVRDVLYDSPRKRCYLTTPEKPGDSRFGSDSLVVMDPETGEIIRTIALGETPGQLALSGDGSTLYVVLEGAGIVKRLDAESLAVTSELRFRPAADARFGYARVGLAILPGSQSTVGLYYAPNVESSPHQLAIFDDGGKRRNEVRQESGYDSVRFSPDGQYFFVGAQANFNSPQTVLRYTVDASGFPDPKPLTASGGGAVEIIGDLLYTSRGTVVNYKTMEVVGSIGTGGAMGVDAERSRLLVAHFLRADQAYPQYLQAFDRESQLPLGWIPLSYVNYFGAGSSPVQRLIRFGTDGLIFTESRGLLIFHTPLAGPAPALDDTGIQDGQGKTVSAIAPGDVLLLSGDNLGPDPGRSADGATTSLSGVRVWFDYLPGVLRSVSKNQVNVVVPDGLSPGSTVRLQLWHFGLPSARVPLIVRSAVN